MYFIFLRLFFFLLIPVLMSKLFFYVKGSNDSSNNPLNQNQGKQGIRLSYISPVYNFPRCWCMKIKLIPLQWATANFALGRVLFWLRGFLVVVCFRVISSVFKCVSQKSHLRSVSASKKKGTRNRLTITGYYQISAQLGFNFNCDSH